MTGAVIWDGFFVGSLDILTSGDTKHTMFDLGMVAFVGVVEREKPIITIWLTGISIGSKP